jgi:hypothetical protein
MSKHVLGVNVVEPGSQTILIDPHLGDLQWVEGTFPTPHGQLFIRHEKLSDGTVKSEVSGPDGVNIIYPK